MIIQFGPPVPWRQLRSNPPVGRIAPTRQDVRCLSRRPSIAWRWICTGSHRCPSTSPSRCPDANYRAKIMGIVASCAYIRTSYCVKSVGGGSPTAEGQTGHERGELAWKPRCLGGHSEVGGKFGSQATPAALHIRKTCYARDNSLTAFGRFHRGFLVQQAVFFDI